MRYWIATLCLLIVSNTYALDRQCFSPLSVSKGDGFDKIIKVESAKPDIKPNPLPAPPPYYAPPIPVKPAGDGWQYDNVKGTWWRYEVPTYVMPQVYTNIRPVMYTQTYCVNGNCSGPR